MKAPLPHVRRSALHFAGLLLVTGFAHAQVCKLVDFEQEAIEPLQFGGDMTTLCNAFHGTPSNLPLPPIDGIPQSEELYIQVLGDFIRERKYDTEHQWLHDRDWRILGPFQGCPPGGLSFGVHPPSRIYYSPEVVEWLCAGRPAGGIPDGAMIIKEMNSVGRIKVNPGAPNAGDIWLDEADYAEPGFWAVMVKRAASSWDGWYWASIGKDADGNPPVIGSSGVTASDFFDGPDVEDHLDTRYPTGAPTDRGGVDKEGSAVVKVYSYCRDCINCHASADSESTFSSLNNIYGLQHRYPYLGEGSPGHRGNHHGREPKVEHHTYAQPLPQPDPAFLMLFDQFGSGGVSFNDAIANRLPAQTYDHNVAKGTGQGATNTEEFLTSDQCFMCHDATITTGGVDPSDPKARVPNMTYPPDEVDGVNLSPYAEWSVSPMGLAGRDPIFYAQLETERNLVAGNAVLEDCVENLCLHCHGVMGQRQHVIDKGEGSICPENFLDESISEHQLNGATMYTREFLDKWADDGTGDNKYGGLSRDGISCTVCHHMAETNLGEPSTYTGNFIPGPPNEIYGPDYTPRAIQEPMQHALGITPLGKSYTSSSAMCGSCHAINLPVLDSTSGNIIGHTFEQTTYLEWLNSEYNPDYTVCVTPGVSCQDCHMPTKYDGNDLSFKIANIQDDTMPMADFVLNGTGPVLEVRTPYSRHTLYGLNVFLNEMFQQFPLLLGFRQMDYMNDLVRPALLTGRESVLEIAREQTATIQATLPPPTPKRLGSTIDVDVTVENLAGHKLPSGVGFRRVFLEFIAYDGPDGTGSMVWASGRTNSLGVILEGLTDFTLPSEFFDLESFPDECEATANDYCYQPHYEIIDSERQVQIYEELVQNSLGEFTDSFVHRLNKIKDNRLLPACWSSLGDWAADTAPIGNAVADPDYGPILSAGTDTVRYSIPNNLGAQSVVVSLYSQSIPPHYLAARFDNATKAGHPYRTDTERLHYITSRLNLSATADDGEPYLENWKLLLVQTPPLNLP